MLDAGEVKPGAVVVNCSGVVRNEALVVPEAIAADVMGKGRPMLGWLITGPIYI